MREGRPTGCGRLIIVLPGLFRSLLGVSFAMEKDSDASKLTNSVLRSRLGTLGRDHDNLPALITKL